MGPKPGWLRRLEAKSQERFDRQADEGAARADELATREAEAITPSGKRHLVRAVPRGEPLRDWGDTSAAGVLVEAMVAATSAWRARRSSGWTVGIVRSDGPMAGERILHRERLSAGEDVQARIDALAEAIRTGSYSPRRR